VISDDLTTAAERTECLTLIVDGLVEMARNNGADTLISLSPLPFMRAMRQVGYDVERLGEAYRNDEDGRLYGVLKMPAEFSRARRERARPIPFPAWAVARPGASGLVEAFG
jgi:acyl homoserine lactone synthase